MSLRFVRLAAVLVGVSLFATGGHAGPLRPPPNGPTGAQSGLQACLARCGRAPTSGEYSHRCTYYQAVYSNQRCKSLCQHQTLSPTLESQASTCSRACSANEPVEPDTGVPERCVPLVNSLAAG
jgi:hypothetical protein